LKSTTNKFPGNNWINRWDQYIDDFYPKVIPQFNTKYSEELEVISASEKYSFSAKAALYWKIKTESFFKYDELGYKLLLVLYEDFVTSTKRNLIQICKFLNVSFNENMLKHNVIGHPYTTNDGLTVGNTNVRRRIDSEAVGLYKGQMSEEEQKIILSIAGSVYEKIQLKWKSTIEKSNSK